MASTYEVEVEAGKAMLVDEYEAICPCLLLRHRTCSPLAGSRGRTASAAALHRCRSSWLPVSL